MACGHFFYVLCACNCCFGKDATEDCFREFLRVASGEHSNSVLSLEFTGEHLWRLLVFRQWNK